MSILQVVKGSPLFYELYDEEIVKIVETCTVQTMQPGDFVFRENDSGDEIFIVLQGTARVRKGEVDIGKLRKGDLFGEMVLLKENVRKADIYVDSYCDILVLKYDDIFNLYEINNKIFSVLMLNLARMLATRLHKAGDTIMDLSVQLHQFKKAG